MTSPPYTFGVSGNRKAAPRNQRLLQQHNMTGSMFVDRGLLNKPGENNCFLNSAIQVLWHIDVFRRSFRQLHGHYCVGQSCIFCALREVFKEYQYTHQSAIPPNELRSALAVCFKAQHKFQLGLMEDASECYEEILSQLHFHLTGNHDDDTCSAPHCIPHQKFALTLLERTQCECSATSEPLPMVQFIHYYSVAALVKELQVVKSKNLSIEKDPSLFARMLHNAYCIDNDRECPNYINCHQIVRPKQILLNTLDVLCIGLIWDSDQPTVQLIRLLSDAIGLKIKLSNLFDQTLTEESQKREYQLTAVVAYYGKHYSTFCYHGNHREWVYLDDAAVRQVGKKWSDVRELFKKGHYQPLLLIYSYHDAKPIDASTAPTRDIITVPTTSSTGMMTNVDKFDNTTEANDHVVVPTNATPTENMIIGVSNHSYPGQPNPSNQQDTVSALPPPPQVDRTHHNNIVTNALLPVTNSPRGSPAPSSQAVPRGISPVNNAGPNSQNEDLISFESVSSQLIAASNHTPFPISKPYPGSVTVNEIQPFSATNRLASGPASLIHSHVNAVTTATTNSANGEDDLITLDTLKATQMTNMKQESLAKNPIGPFEQDMVVVVKKDFLRMSDNSYPHPRGLAVASDSQLSGVTMVTASQLAPTNSNASQTSSQHQRSNLASNISANQMREGQLSYRDGFGVSQSDVLCVEAMQLWVKAEMSLAKGDKAVGLLAFQRVSELLQRALKDPSVQSNITKRAKMTEKRNEAIKKADTLKKEMDSEKTKKQKQGVNMTTQMSPHAQRNTNNNNPRSHSSHESVGSQRPQLCKKCGQMDRLKGRELCGPCDMKEKYKR